MKNVALILFLTVISWAGIAQGKSGFGFFTDRDVYVSGESVLAKMYLPSGNSSTIVHLDLVNKSGKWISGASIEIKNNQADGYLQLPDSLSSGTYLLRAYLKSNSEECRMNREIWIANRFDGLGKITEINVAVNVEQLQVQMNDEIKFSGLENEVKNTSNVQAQVELGESLLGKLDGKLLISVARSIPQFESSTFRVGCANVRDGLTETKNELSSSKGILYKGTVTDKTTSKPVANITVCLTIPDSIPKFQYYITGKDGQFSFLTDDNHKDVQALLHCYSNNPAQRSKDKNLQINYVRSAPQAESSTLQRGSAMVGTGLTESKGIIYSGTITDKTTAAPVPNVTVYLTIPDSIPEFQYYITGNDGRFYFLIDHYYGNIKAVIQCFPNNSAQHLKIVQDEPFASIGAMPEFRSKPIPEEFKTEIVNSIDATTFQKIFEQEMLSKNKPPKKKLSDYAYYGIPSRQVDPQLFIDLPNFSEISKELLPGVKFRNYNNEPTLRVTANNIYFEEQPLVVLDGIPIRDLNLIKNMGTKDIDRVDICQEERFYGDLRFPGVVAIYSTKPDYSNLPESDQLIKLETEAKQIPVQLAEPIVSAPSIPDFRQTLYWNASAEPMKNIEVKFATSNVRGHFKMIIRGQTTDGTLIYSEKKFEVK